MDGVLVDSEDAWVPRERDDLLPRVVPDQEVALAEITGMNYRDIYDYLAAEYDVAMSKADFVAWYDDAATTVYGEAVSLLPGVRDLLADCRAAGIPVAIVSSSPVAWIDIVRDRFDLAVDAVVSGDDFEGPGKPAPDLYEHAAAELGVEPADAIAVEDAVHGIAAALDAGLTVVGFRFGDDHGTSFDDAHHAPADHAALHARLRDLLGLG
jgi:HAD superfamily hydrolase (TIGR01509 family)